MNCIDCENLIRWGKDKNNKEFYTQCEKANPNIRQCGGFKRAKRVVEKVEGHKLKEEKK